MRMSVAALRRSKLRIASITPAARSLPAKKCQRTGPSPHDLLWAAVAQHYASARREYPDAVPNRRFRLDIAITAQRIAIEVDGWEWHGKHKNDFKRDRERQNLLVLNGWRVLRFTASDIRRDMAAVMETIRAACGDQPQPEIEEELDPCLP